MFDFRRTYNCGDLNKSHIGETVTLSGWVHGRRDHGGLIFIDLRDRFGLTQLIFDPKASKKEHDLASNLRDEWVISIKGIVIPRSEGMTNPNLPTGEIEIEVKELEILSESKNPPFSISEENIEVNEELRLKYRYLDIRRGDIAKKLIMRHKAMLAIRNFLNKEGFLEIATPILCKSTPEGARDYLVPSRIYTGNFYALPQSPQIFKQLLMISGMDRYFQLAVCFRDEDLRADRQPEFTQIDMEMSFSIPEDIYKTIENLMKSLFKTCLDVNIETPFLRISYKDCIEKYGSDKPDLRFDMPLVRIDDIAKNCTFPIFQEVLKENGVIKGICVRKGAEISRKGIDEYSSFIEKFEVKGLLWMKKTKEGLSSSIVKFFSQEQLEKLEQRFKINEGDLILLAFGVEANVNQGLDHLCRYIAKQRKLISKNSYKFLWVQDFPLYKRDSKTGRIECEHHPFTSPHFEDIPLLKKDPLKARAMAYDLVLNGYELASGSQRIHNSSLQKQIFEILQLSEEEIKTKFNYFIEALKYGTPPHLGIAVGFDRLLMLITGTENIRDVIAFPKTQKASDLMMQTPSPVNKEQLEELKIKATPTPISWA